MMETLKTIPRILTVLSCTLLLAVAGTFAYGAQKDKTQPTKGPQFAGTTRGTTVDMSVEFARRADQSNLAEIRLGQLAEDNSTNPTVKAFGKRMVDDHSKANEQLEKVASADGITLPKTLDRGQQTEYTHMAQLSGPQFDRAYARLMVQDHRRDISEFKTEADSGGVQDIKNFAANTLPVVDEHLKLARHMENAVSGSSGNNNATPGAK